MGIYLPLYNALIFLIDVVPGGDVGLAVILLTVFVRLVLFPLIHQGIKTQLAMRAVQSKIDEINNKYKDNREEAAKQTFALYKEYNIHPFAQMFGLLIQIPIILGLFWVFRYAGLPNVDSSALYSFVHVPQAPNMQFLGLIDMAGKSVVLATLAGLTQFIYAKLSFPAPDKNAQGFKGDFARSFYIQILYVFPILMAFLAYSSTAAIGLYFLVGNLFSIAQEVLVHRRMRKAQ